MVAIVLLEVERKRDTMDKLTAIRIDADGTLAICQIDKDSTGSALDSMCAALDVHDIETFGLPGNIDVIFDEEGKPNGSRPNRRATAAVLMLGARFLAGDPIVGNALFLGFTDEGEHVSLTQEQLRRIIVSAN